MGKIFGLFFVYLASFFVACIPESKDYHELFSLKINQYTPLSAFIYCIEIYVLCMVYTLYFQLKNIIGFWMMIWICLIVPIDILGNFEIPLKSIYSFFILISLFLFFKMDEIYEEAHSRKEQSMRELGLDIKNQYPLGGMFLITLIAIGVAYKWNMEIFGG